MASTVVTCVTCVTSVHRTAESARKGWSGVREAHEKLEALCQNLSFSSMKKNAGVLAPAAGKPYFKSDSSFFSSGQNRQWQEVLGPDDIGCYQTRSRSLLPESDLHWLENGGTRGPL